MVTMVGLYGMQGLPYIGNFSTAILDILGYNQMMNSQRSYQAQINYEQYLREGNRRALADWHKNVPNRQIKYPELSYAGQMYRSDTAIARASFDYANAGSNYRGSLPYRAMGLYGIGGRLSRTL